MTVLELYSRFQNNEDITLIDVREDAELNICAISGAKHIPMSRVPSCLDTLKNHKELVIMCHHGIRSSRVVNFLREQGFQNVHNLEGGIDAWAIYVDTEMKTY